MEVCYEIDNDCFTLYHGEVGFGTSMSSAFAGDFATNLYNLARFCSRVAEHSKGYAL